MTIISPIRHDDKMTATQDPDPDSITRTEAAALLDVGVDTVTRLRREGLLTQSLGGRHLYSRTEIEAFATNPWISAAEVAEILGVSRARVSQLASAGKIPFHRTRSNKRVYRDQQIRVVKNARSQRLGKW